MSRHLSFNNCPHTRFLSSVLGLIYSNELQLIICQLILYSINPLAVITSMVTFEGNPECRRFLQTNGISLEIAKCFYQMKPSSLIDGLGTYTVLHKYSDNSGMFLLMQHITFPSGHNRDCRIQT